MTLDRQRFIEDLRSLVAQNVIFRHQGNDPATGLDCIHAPAAGMEMQGIILPDELKKEMAAYSDQPDGWKMLELLRAQPKYFQEIPVIDNKVPDEALPGDLLQMFVYRNPKHMAILSSRDPLSVIEAWRSATSETGKLIEVPLDFRRRVAACFRMITDFASQA
jgi:hypothetical protein